MALLRHLLLYLEFPAHFVCDMKRINAFFSPKILTSALHTGAIKGLCNAFCHCSFPEEMLYPPHVLLSCIFESSAIKGTVLYMSDPGVNSEIECIIL
jgi:hypothetical protein